MIRFGPGARDSSVRVTFLLPCDHPADAVGVVGDFNRWDPAATPLREREDRLSASVELRRGRRYAFSYESADGTWFNDEPAGQYVENARGGASSVIDLTR